MWKMSPVGQRKPLQLLFNQSNIANKKKSSRRRINEDQNKALQGWKMKHWIYFSDESDVYCPNAVCFWLPYGFLCWLSGMLPQMMERRNPNFVGFHTKSLCFIPVVVKTSGTLKWFAPNMQCWLTMLLALTSSFFWSSSTHFLLLCYNLTK